MQSHRKQKERTYVTVDNAAERTFHNQNFLIEDSCGGLHPNSVVGVRISSWNILLRKSRDENVVCVGMEDEDVFLALFKNQGDTLLCVGYMYVQTGKQVDGNI